MSEKSQYDLRNDADVQESTEIDSLSSKNKESLNSIIELNNKVDGHQKSLSVKEEIIQKLTSQVDKSSHTLFDYYQKSLSVKDDTIRELSTQVDGQNNAAVEYHERLSEKEGIISQLTTQVDEQKEAAGEYQKRLSEKEDAVSERDEIINQLASRIDNLNVFTEEYQKSLPEKEETINQRTARLDSQNVIPLEQITDEEKEEAIPQVIPETDFSDVMVQVKSLYNDGKYDDAYRIADDLRKKYPRLGLAYYILGAIGMLREYYDKGEELLNHAVQFGLPDEDMAWAFHNLGISSLRKKNYKKAREFLEKSVKLNLNMEKSMKTLELLNNLQEKERDDKEEVEAVDGKMEARILTT